MNMLQHVAKFCFKSQLPKQQLLSSAKRLGVAATTSNYSVSVGVDDDLLGFSDEQKEVNLFMIFYSQFLFFMFYKTKSEQ